MAILAHVFYPTMTAKYLRTAQNSLVDDLLSLVCFEHRFFDGCLDLKFAMLGVLGDPFSDLLPPTSRSLPRKLGKLLALDASNLVPQGQSLVFDAALAQ
jgi:hypothetical protein